MFIPINTLLERSKSSNVIYREEVWSKEYHNKGIIQISAEIFYKNNPPLEF